MSMIDPEDLSRVRQYVANVRWQFAKTYAETAPHEYTVRQWDWDASDDFSFMVVAIRQHGYVKKFWGKPYTYFELDGFKYWTMGAPVDETTVINREPLGG